MVEEIFEHKGKFCPNLDCPERIIKLEYEHLYKKEKEDRDNLHEQLRKIKNALDKKNIKENKEDVEWLTKHNLSLAESKDNFQQKLTITENQLNDSIKEIEELRKYKQEQETFSRKQIDEYASMPEKLKILAKEIENQQIQKARNGEELLKQNNIIAIGKKEIEKKLKELEGLQENISQEKQNKKNLKKTRKINKLIAKAFKYKDMFRIDKAKKMQVKIKKEFEKLDELQKNLVRDKYNEAITI